MGKTIVNERPLTTIMMNENIAKVLSDPHRLKILDFLYHRNLSTKDLFDLLKRAKFNIAMTTLRHHITILKKNGLISVYKTQEVKGTLVKYYKANVKMLTYENFPFVSFVRDNKEIIDLLYPKFYKVIKKIMINEKNFTTAISSESKSKCRICKTFHYAEFLIFMILNMIITKVLRKLMKSRTNAET
jgi:DNA-binding transcriptional ArsR family regulator